MRRKIENILTNLSRMELKFIEESPSGIDFNNYQTYANYLNSFFIREHNLSNVYWPNHIRPLPKSIKEYPVLDDNLLFLTGHDIAFGKQISFPSQFMHSMKYLDILYIVTGNATVSLETEEIHLKEGNLLFIGPNTSCSINTSKNSIAIHLMFRLAYVKNKNVQLAQNNLELSHFFGSCITKEAEDLYIWFKSGENDLIKECILNAFAEYLWSDYYSNSIIENNIMLLFSYLNRHESDDIVTNFAINTTERNFAKIERYLQDNYATATLAQAAEELHFSKQHICRIVKECKGKTFVDLLTEYKILRASKYMVETSFSLEVIAELTGFTDAAYLSKVFKKYTGLSPSSYRKRG